MRKVLLVLLLAALAVGAIFFGLGKADPLSAIDRATSDDLAVIRTHLEQCGIAVEGCELTDLAADPLIADDLPTGYVCYTVTDESGEEYYLVLNAGDRGMVVAIADTAENYLFGGLDGLFG